MSLELSKKISAVKPSSTLQLQEKIIKLKKEGRNIISFTVGEPDFNTPKNISDAAKKAIDDGFTKYTAVTGIIELKRLIANKFNIENNLNYSEKNIVISNGGKQCLSNALTAILNEGDEVIIFTPAWLSYKQMVKIAGGIPVMVNTNDNYKIDINQLEKNISNKTKAIIINSPNNPTGAVYTEKELQTLAEYLLNKDIYVISDEIYEYLNYTNEKHYSIGSYSKEMLHKTITINGFSKSYSMTGWRIGYLGANEKIVEMINKIQGQQTSNVCSIVQKACVEALTGDKKEVINMIKTFELRRNILINYIKAFPYISYKKPEGAFYLLIDLKNIIGKKFKDNLITDINVFAELLLENYDVAVIPCIDFDAPTSIRLSYALSEDNINIGMQRIKNMLEEIK